MEAVLALGGSEGEAGENDPRCPRRWAFLHLATGILTSVHRDYDRAVALYEHLGYRRGTSGPLRELGVVAYHGGDYKRAVRLSEQALTVARECGSALGSDLAVCTLADALRAQGNSSAPGRSWKRAFLHCRAGGIRCASSTRLPARSPGSGA